MSPKPRKRVLVVEDSRAIRNLIVKLLAERGFQVDSAAGALQAVRHIGPYELLVLDIQLPNGSVEDITRQFPGVPVLTMSGFPGAQLRKPFLAAQLYAAVDEVLTSRTEALMARQSLSQTLSQLPALQHRALIPAPRRKSQWVRTVLGGLIFVGGFFLPKFLGFPWQAGVGVAGLGAFMASQQLVMDYAKALPQVVSAILGAFKGGSA